MTAFVMTIAKTWDQTVLLIDCPVQDEQPNDRKISKLCEYAAKNPLRIPKITTSLEQRCYKELRMEQFHSVKIVMSIYKKLLVSCNEQMYAFVLLFNVTLLY